MTHEQFARRLAVRRPSLLTYGQWAGFVNYRCLAPLLPEDFKLTVAAAMEQLNFSIAQFGLQQMAILQSESEFNQMLKWHFVEEIEHREVVFSLMETRRIGRFQKSLAMGLAFFSFYLWIGLGGLLVRTRLKGFNQLALLTKMMVLAAIRFIKSGYHPSQESIAPSFFALQEKLEFI